MKPPKRLSDKAKGVWEDIERVANKQLNKADYVIIENLCCEVDVYDRAVDEMKSGDMESERTGQLSSVVSARNQAANNIRMLYKEVAKFVRVDKIEDENKDEFIMKSVKKF